jgi:hypothetical protein
MRAAAVRESKNTGQAIGQGEKPLTRATGQELPRQSGDARRGACEANRLRLRPAEVAALKAMTMPRAESHEHPAIGAASLPANQKFVA